MNFFQRYFETVGKKIQEVDFALFSQAIDSVKKSSSNGNKIIIAGNGGSASIASHVAVDLTKNAKIRTIDFNEAGLITCFANDYGYEYWIEKALEFYGSKGDVCILISSSGKSINIINAGKRAKAMGMALITFSDKISTCEIKMKIALCLK